MSQLMQKRKTIIVSVALAALAMTISGIWVLSGGRGDGIKDLGIDLGSLKFGQEGEGSGSPNGSGEGQYHHLDPEFSFEYREGWTVTNFTEGEGETVLVRDSSGSEMQIFMRPFDEAISMTPENIRRDIPDIVIREPKEVAVGGAQALSFASGTDLGETREVWFSNAGYLYQVSAPINYRDMVQALVTSWKW